MSSLYPQAVDCFRRLANSADEAHAQLFRELYDAIIAVQAELGVKPSGLYGSLYGRMYGADLVSRRNGYWRRLACYIQSVFDGQLGVRFAENAEAQWQAGRMDGVNTSFGEDTPFVFLHYQGRGPGTPLRGGLSDPRPPWNLYAWFPRPERTWMAATDILHGRPGTFGPGLNVALIGVVAWGLQPSQVRTVDEQ